MDPSSILSKSDIEEPRSPAELEAWLHEICSQFGETRKGKTYLREKQGLTKQLVEEVWPLLRFAQAKYGCDSAVQLRPVIGSQKYDAIVDTGSSQFKVEVTYGMDGYQESHRMKILEAEGSVSVFAPIQVTGTKHTGYEYEQERVAYSNSAIFGRYIEDIARAYSAKVSKAYDEVPVLIIGFDDFMVFSEPEDGAAFKFLLANTLPRDRGSFKEVWVVGALGKFSAKL